MKYKYLTIGVKKLELRVVEEAIDNLEIVYFLKKYYNHFHIEITIEDLRENYFKMAQFLKENNIDDELSFFNEFEIAPFGLQIDFNVMNGFKFMDFLEPVIFLVGQQLSTVLKEECIVFFENLTVPVALYNNGNLINTFEKYNSAYFKNKLWKPNY